MPRKRVVRKDYVKLPKALDDLANKFGLDGSITGKYLLDHYGTEAFHDALKIENGKSFSLGYINSWKYYIVPPGKGPAIWMRYLKRCPHSLTFAGPGLRFQTKVEGNSDSDNDYALPSPPSSFPKTRINGERQTSSEPPRKRLRKKKPVSEMMQEIAQECKVLEDQKATLEIENDALKRENDALKRENERLKMLEAKFERLKDAVQTFETDEDGKDIVLQSFFGGESGIPVYKYQFRDSRFQEGGEHYECLQRYKKFRKVIPEALLNKWVEKFRKQSKANSNCGNHS